VTPFPAHLRAARIACNLTQAELARRVGFKDRRVISEYERGKSEPTRALIEVLARAMHVPPCWLAGWTTSEIY